MELTKDDLIVGQSVLFTVGDADPIDAADCEITRVDALGEQVVVLFSGDLWSHTPLVPRDGSFYRGGLRYRLWRF